MNFQQADTSDILESSRFSEYNDTLDMFQMLDDTDFDISLPAFCDMFSERTLNAYDPICTTKSTVNYLLADEELCLEDVEAFASENGLMDNEMIVSQSFAELCGENIYTMSQTDIDCSFNDYKDSLEKNGDIHQLQASEYEFDNQAKIKSLQLSKILS